jgi:hypothetical protein
MSKDKGCGCNTCEDCGGSTAMAPKMNGHQVTILSGTEARHNGNPEDADRKSGTYFVIGSAFFLATVAFFTSKK